MNTDRERLLRFLEGALPEDQSNELETRLEFDDDLRNQLAVLRSMREHFASARPDSFAPYFSDRVMNRISPPVIAAADSPYDSLYDSLRWLFVRTAVACLLVAIVIGSYNVITYQGLEVAGSIVEALFGLPSDTLSDALAYGSL